MSADPAVAQFVAAARVYSRLLEDETVLPPRDLVHKLLSALLALYSAGLALPEVDLDEDRGEDYFMAQTERYPCKQL